MTRRLVTVDGPAGSGKSTLARRLARALGVPIIDTGALYRAVTVAGVRRGIDPDADSALARLTAAIRIHLETDPGHPDRVTVDGEEVTAALHDPALAPLLARVSSDPGVRRELLEPQRSLLRNGEGVAAGRDCGTVVFPEATVKLYLEAQEEIRLVRRAAQLDRLGKLAPAVLEAEVARRDRSDASRAAAPMRPAPGALVLRTDELDIEATLLRAIEACRAAGMLAAP